MKEEMRWLIEYMYNKFSKHREKEYKKIFWVYITGFLLMGLYVFLLFAIQKGE